MIEAKLNGMKLKAFYQMVLGVCIMLSALEAKASAPTWTVNAANYQYNMIGVLRIITSNNTFYNEEGTILRAIVEGETRGLVESDDIIFVGGEAYFPITMYSNTPVGDTLHFEVYIEASDSVYAVSEYAIFDRHENLGSPPSPFLLSINLCEDILVLSSDDQPFRSWYSAGSEIHLTGPMSTLTDNLILKSPIVKLIDGGSLTNMASITIQNLGCSP